MPDMMPGGPPGAMPGGAPGGAPGGMPDPAALMALMKLNRKRGGGLKHRKKGKRKK